MCKTRCRRSLFFLVFLVIRTFHLTDEKGGCKHHKLPKKACKGRVIESDSARTEIQCMDLCLRQDICDSVIFSETKQYTCNLLNTDMTYIPGQEQLHEKSGSCIIVRSADNENARDFVLGTNNCP
ncbi:uncharacterized protein [Porites lutea]|uniref:uncharacterized protein n=1 Tax=Porites lutea TaxID=51062 RepID=UPI003CC5A888